jgi:predicted GIY-YIG superfamily endonuclease
MLTDCTRDVFDLFDVEQEPAAPPTKTCSKCREDKPLSKYNRRKGSGDGVRNDCKACQYERAQAWREANRAKINAKAQVWREAHRAVAVAYARQYRGKNREQIAATLKANRQANIEMFRSRERAYAAADRGKYADRGRAWYESNKDRVWAKREAKKHPQVYRIDFADGYYYIGKSNNPKQRFLRHRRDAAVGRSASLLNEQDWSTATWRVLLECDTDDEALEVEAQIIEESMDDPKNLNKKSGDRGGGIYWVYVIQSEQKRVSTKTGEILEGFFYVGFTSCPARRLREHNGLYANGEPGNPNGSKYTSHLRPWVARACYGPFNNRSEALKAEYALKRGKRGAARCKWTPEDSPYCRGEGEAHPWVADPTGWKPPKE